MREYFLKHSPIEFRFAQNPKDFVVDEVPLYEFSGEGEHLILKVRKRDLTTWEMVKIISEKVGISARDIGYAGLKDKNAMTMQYISLPKKVEEKLADFDEKNISILERTYHNNKIKLGHLKGNKFFIRLKKVNPTSASMLTSAIQKIADFGMPNFFGYQRFGVEGNNFELGKDILAGKRYIKDKKKRQLFINAYQSHLFNEWLSERIKFSRLVEEFDEKELPAVFENLGLDIKNIDILKKQPQPFKLLIGDILLHYPHGKAFILSKDEFEDGLNRFTERQISPSGLLIGKKAIQSVDDAKIYEEKIIEDIKGVDGERKYAWIFPEIFDTKYRETDFWFEINFFLPKGSYATTFIEELAKREIKE
jgi:tRNA pseudouridine13 synthase